MSLSKRNAVVQAKFNENDNLTWTGPFCFIQGADTQLGMIESYLEKKPNPGWEKEIVLIKKAIGAANRMTPKPKFFIVCGDLIDAMPGTQNRDAQMRDFKIAFEGLENEIPLVCVCGNHDVGDCPTPAAVQDFRDSYGDDYFAFYVSGVLMIVLNSQYYENRSLVKDIAEKQDAWLDALLEDAKGKNFKHIVVYQHIPWFLRTPDEEKEYFNIESELRLSMLNKFYDAGVRYIFCGHYHQNTGGKFKDLELVVTSAVGAPMGEDDSGLRVVRVQEESIQHDYYAMADIPISIDL